MRRTLFSIAGILLFAAPAFAQSARTDSIVKDYLNAAQERALARAALQSHGLTRDTGSGPEVDLTIRFPSSQTGIDNLMVTDLVPVGVSVHSAQAIVVKQGGTDVTSSFAPVKDVRPGVTYDVVVSDSMRDKYRVGRITIGSSLRQSFTIAAPLLGPGSPVYNGPQRAANTFQPWMLGIRGVTITPALLRSAGISNTALRGVIVLQVIAGSAAQREGLQDGDVILVVNGRRAISMEEVLTLTANRRQGARTILGFARSGRLYQVSVPVLAGSTQQWHAPAIGPGYVRPSSHP